MVSLSISVNEFESLPMKTAQNDRLQHGRSGRIFYRKSNFFSALKTRAIRVEAFVFGRELCVAILPDALTANAELTA